MTRVDKEIVSILRQSIADKIGQERYNLWFGSTVELELEGETLRVAAPDQFTLDRLRKNFREDILSVCRQVLHGEATLDFRVEASLRRPKALAESARAPAAVAPHDSEPPVAISLEQNVKRRRRPLASLDTFVLGGSNRVAFTAATTVLQRPGVVSPLYVYGPSGCGKTHLLEGICSAARRHGRRMRTVSLSAEQFTSQFLEALQGSGLPNFRRKYRDVDLMLIDDVQFFASKRATLVELQHTIDTLLRDGKQMVFAADRSPAELSGFGRELTARMSGGLVCSVEPPEQETRLGILQQLAAQRRTAFPKEVLQWLASQLQGDARQLQGALNRLEATSEALQQAVTLQLAETALEDVLRATRPLVHLPDIERAVCDVFGLQPQSLQSGRKARAVSHPRMLAMWLARKYTRAALSEIGHYFGRRSHSTVISAQNKVERWVVDGMPIQLAHGSCHVEDAIRRVESQLRTG